jgi:hypothetical protein
MSRRLEVRPLSSIFCPSCHGLLINPAAVHKCVAAPPRSPVTEQLELSAGANDPKSR